MSAYQAALPARQLHARLRQALIEMRRAEKNALLCFAEILKRKLYRELGYSSIQLYASEALGFSRAKTSQFIRLAESLDKLPALRESMAAGEIPWTKARVVAKAASRQTEGKWIAEAKRSSRRELERKVEQSRARAKAEGERDSRQGSLLALSGSGQAAEVDCGQCSPDMPPCSLEVELPQPLTLNFSSEQRARYEALVEKVRKVRGRNAAGAASREELLLAGLEALLRADGQRRAAHQAAVPPAENTDSNVCAADVGGGGDSGLPVEAGDSGREFTRVNSSSPYQIVVFQCESCAEGWLRTGAGERKLSTATMERLLCDARVQETGKRNRATIPPAMRRAVLARDRQRCRMQGCGKAAFLEVHHMVPRRSGGKNEPGNLVTLCSSCHQLIHERRLKAGDLKPLLRRVTDDGGRPIPLPAR